MINDDKIVKVNIPTLIFFITEPNIIAPKKFINNHIGINIMKSSDLISDGYGKRRLFIYLVTKRPLLLR